MNNDNNLEVQWYTDIKSNLHFLFIETAWQLQML